MGETVSIDYQALFASLPHAYIAFLPDDPNFTIIAENAAHAKIANTTTKKIIGKPLFDVFPDVSEKYQKTGVSDLAESLRTVIKTGKPDIMPVLHYDIPRRDGSFEERSWRVSHHPVFGKGKKLEVIYQVTEDVSKTHETESKLDQAQTLLGQALSSGLIGTWMWDVAQDRVVGGPNMARMFGVTEAAAADGLPLEAFTSAIHPDDRDRLRKEIDQSIKNNDTFSSEYRILRPDGSTLWVMARGHVERDAAGKAAEFPGVLIDITDRKISEMNLSFLAKAGAELSASLDYKKTLQSIARLAVPEIADWCTIEMFNEDGQLQTVAVVHKDPAKIAWALELRKQQGPPDLMAETGLAKVLRTGEAEFYPEITDAMLRAGTTSDKQYRLMKSIGFSSVMIVPLSVDDRPVGAITLITAEQKRHYTTLDLEMANELASRASTAITNASLYNDARKELAARRKLEEQLRLVNEELETRVTERTLQLENTNASLQRSNQELQDFAYVASHDLQEPLRKIQAFGNLLEEEYAEQLGDGKDYLVRMRSAAARMSALIEDILSFSRVTTKARGFSPVDLSKVALEVLDDLETRIEDTSATIQLDNLPTIDADAMQIRQLLQNLIGNALKFHKPNVPPVIKISATTEILQNSSKKFCTIRVTDNGVGFDEKYLDRIFAVFQRLHGRDVYEGTGIGLAVCRKIVERHGGTISATSKLGHGATFIISLPIHHSKKETQGDTL